MPQCPSPAFMTLVCLGVLPMLLGILAASPLMLVLGIIMADAAADILIVYNILRCKSRAENVRCIDHPTQAGGVVFEK